MRTIALTEVMASFGLEIKRVGADSIYYNCPFCGDNKAKLNVIPTSNIWRCARCGVGGGLMHFIENINHCDREDARKFLREFNSNDSFKLDSKIQEKMIKAQKQTEELASENVRHLVYSSMLKKLSLREEHYEDLKRRGLNDLVIANREYKSVPLTIRNAFNTSIPTALIKEGLSLKGVPGFFKKEGKWYMNNAIQGYLIPYRNIDGKITNLQIRTDDSKNGKYMSFSSSGYPHGAKVSSQGHFISKTPSPEKIYLTEGALKGDIATYYIKKLFNTNASFLCIPGVNQTNCLISAIKSLKDRGLKEVVCAFDMDKFCQHGIDSEKFILCENCSKKEKCECNVNVAKAIKKIKIICEEDFNLKYTQMLWAKEKGIDDYLYLKFKNSQ